MKSIQIFLLSISSLLLVLNISFGQSLTLSVAPTTQTVAAGDSVTFDLSVIPGGGFNAQVFFSIVGTNLPISLITEGFTPGDIFSPYHLVFG